MTHSPMPHLQSDHPETRFYALSPDEKIREAALRERFARFWESQTGDLRMVYDHFIAACPIHPDALLFPVEETDVQGWWVRPPQPEADSVILYLHGGGYVLGSARAYRGFASQIAMRTNISVLVIDYPLAPEHSLPDAPDAALRAWSFLIAQGFHNIAIAGDSAGGGLTLATLQQIAARKDAIAPRAGVMFSPWADLAFSGKSMTAPNIVDPLIGHDYLRDCAQKYAGDYAVSHPLASPLYGDFTGLPRLLVQVGSDERLLDDSRQLAERARRAKGCALLEIWEGMHHVFQLDVDHINSSRTALDNAARFLRDAFAQPCPQKPCSQNPCPVPA